MHKLRVWLSGLLVLQLLIASGLFFAAKSEKSDFEIKPLLAFDKKNLNKMVISSGSSEVILVKDKDQWTLPELHNLPVNSGKLDGTLQKLFGLSSNWPVTTTDSSHERFEVSRNKFQRSIKLYEGDEVAGELYIGSTPGFKKSHVRPAQQGNVYALEINSYDFPDKSADWLDKRLLSAKKITTIKGRDFELNKVGEQWQVAAANNRVESFEVNATKANQLSQALASFNITDVIENAPEFNADEVVQIDVSGEGQWQYQFLEKDNKHYVKRSDRTLVFSLSEHDYKRLAGIGMAELKAEKKPEIPDSSVNGTGSGSKGES